MIIDNDAMRKIDAEAQDVYGIPGIVLMENAGRRAWELVEATVSGDSFILFLAGGGNNGGDAMVMARSAWQAGYRRMAVLLLKRNLSDNSAIQMRILSALGVELLYHEKEKDRCHEAISHSDVLIDGLFGAGLRTVLRPETASLVSAVNDAPGRVISVDLPSGLHDGWKRGEPAVRADWTIVTGVCRKILYAPGARSMAGTISRVDPGFPEALIREHHGSVSLLDRNPSLPARAPGSHKGDRGKCLVFAGAPGTGGAALLASRAVLSAGAGMVRLVSNADTCRAALAYEPAIMTEEASGAPAEELIEWADTVLIGPGWLYSSVSDLNRIIGMTASRGKGLVLDAAALLPELLEEPARFGDLGPERFVVTPHIGEAARLLSRSTDEISTRPEETIATLSESLPATVILKGATTWIGTAREISVVDGALPSLGTAGSGDVLAGIVTAFLARGMAGTEAAKEAVLVHHCAGVLTRREWGYPTASQLADAVGSVVATAEMKDEPA